MKLLLGLLLVLGSVEAQSGNLVQQLMCAINRNADGCNGAQSDKAVDLAPTCREQVAESEQCVFDEMMKTKTDSPAEREQKRRLKQQVSRQITQCFVSRGCRDPVSLMKGLKRCMKRSVMQQIVQPWSGCVERQGFDLPQMLRDKLGKDDEDDMAKGFGGRGGRGMNKLVQKLRSKLDVVCDPDQVSPNAANEALDCAVDAVESAQRAAAQRGGNQRRGGFGGMLAGVMGALMKCRSRIGGDCQEYARQRKDAMCRCGNDLSEQQIKTEMTAAWGRCKAAQRIDRQLITGEERRGLEQKLSQGKRMIGMLCSFNF